MLCRQKSIYIFVLSLDLSRKLLENWTKTKSLFCCGTWVWKYRENLLSTKCQQHILRKFCVICAPCQGIRGQYCVSLASRCVGAASTMRGRSAWRGAWWPPATWRKPTGWRTILTRVERLTINRRSCTIPEKASTRAFSMIMKTDCVKPMDRLQHYRHRARQQQAPDERGCGQIPQGWLE